MKCKKGQSSFLVGIALLLVFFLILVTLSALINPFKETLDNNRGTSSLNCPNTPNFNQTDYSDDSQFEKLVKRPTCFVTGISMVYYIGAIIIASVVWVYRNWVRS